MKFGKEFTSQMVQEWQEAYMDYNALKTILKDVLFSRRQNASPLLDSGTPKSFLKRRLSLYRAFSGLTSRYSNKGSPRNLDKEDEVILVTSAMQQDTGSEENYQSVFLMSSEEGGEVELMFFRRLDAELNKVVKFYKLKVEEVMEDAEKLNKQMDALIALRIKNNYHAVAFGGDNGGTGSSQATSSPFINERKPEVPIVTYHSRISFECEGMSNLDVIEEIEMRNEGNWEKGMKPAIESQSEGNKGKAKHVDFKRASLGVLNHVKLNVAPETPVLTLKSIVNSSKSNLSFSKEELKKVEEQLRHAFAEFYRKLRLLKHYSFLNHLAFSKIMKKYDKITSRNASKAYIKMVDSSYLGCSDEVARLLERVESTFIKHFANGNHRKGMKTLRPKTKKEKHRISFLLGKACRNVNLVPEFTILKPNDQGLFSGCSLALIVAIILIIQARNLLQSEGRVRYMDNIFPLYSLFGFIVLHMLMYSGNIYFWKRFRVNYSFIFGFKPGSELGYREVLLLSSGLALLALASVLTNLDMEMNPSTRSFKAITELVPLGLVTVLLLIVFCPFNVIYRSSRFFLIQCAWHCLCSPLYKVTLPDFFLADQLTSQVQAFRSLEFYVCYYGWGDFKRRSNRCRESRVYEIFYIIVAVIPYWSRCLQCLRRLFEERDSQQALNGLKYFLTILAVFMRTSYDLKRGVFWKIVAAATSAVATIFNTYWDIVIDWGLLRRNSRNPWLRDKLLVPNKFVYYAAIVLNVMLRLVWMQLVLDFDDAPFLHRNALVAIVASLEIIRRGIWNFFRLENEHLNNVGKYRAFKSVPLPFSYEDEGKGS
ncbi:hypothetical protein RJ639_040523 [Escallonia herrerae]|uniref:Phosphate transporter PHO1 homolog 9-like n=1 Tax=Escallonia herrerae TaxID=1293975 RepID=A0AA88WFU6_9ASTE|nr:hypothetical protein RJ639_040523 [Escallonia herrerae]